MTNFRGVAVVAAAFVLPATLFMAVSGPSEAVFSQYLGAVALIAMALSQIIATRGRFVEPIFGPLDRAYVLHKWLGITALVAILLHDSIGAEIKGLGAETALSDFAEDLGEQSLNGLLILVAVTLITVIPYRIWYWTHRAMGVCFAMGAIHYVLILKPFSVFDPLGLYVLGFCIMGVASYVYTLTPRTWRRGYLYSVSKVARSGNASVIEMKPIDHPMRHVPGQFAFFTIQAKGMSETHPFTISSAPHKDGHLRVSVGALGDHTARIGQLLQAGTKVCVHGPYGRFAPQKGKKHQVWIAGGIGITPFLAALEGLTKAGPKIDLIYTFRGAPSAPHLQDIQQLAAQTDRVSLHLFDTATGPRLTADDVTKITQGIKPRYTYCGPASLRETLRIGLGSRDFHYEAFQIRTGLPIPKRFLKSILAMFGRSWNPFKTA